MNFSIGDTVGDYRILEELGHGGMGRVFKVEHCITQRQEAMKILAGGRPDEPENAARSLREIQLQASLDHPNIAAVHNAFWADENLVLVMELIDGRSLHSLIEGRKLPLETVVDYARQALSALGYAHAHGVIHRDVSPSNMMISPAGVLKLTDFGLARRPADTRLSHTGSPLGSLYYMSPEQVRGSDADARSDLYSFGAVLYQLATGRKAFDGDSAFAIMEQHIGSMPVTPLEIDGALPLTLNRAILRSMAKDPERRFRSADEFLHGLTGAQDLNGMPAASARRSGFIPAASLAVASLAMTVLVGSRDRHTPQTPLPAKAETTQTIEAESPAPQFPQAVAAPIPSAVRISPSELPRHTSDASSIEKSPAQNIEAESASPAAEDRESGTPTRGRNPVVRVLGRIWHLGRHKQPADDSSARASDDSAQ